MLSRIAESLYWIGRYVERADGTARIVDVVRLSLLETTKSEAAELVLRMIMGIEPSDNVSFDEVRDRLVFDAGNPSSIAGSWYAARENARRAREILPTDLWEVLNTAWFRWRNLGAPDATTRHLSWTRDRAALIRGVADSSMSHDEAWDFLVLGRSLERADMTARLVATGTLQFAGLSWAGVLTACNATQAYTQTHRGVVDDGLTAAFLTLDRQFPRSVVYNLRFAEECLMRLRPANERMGISDEARRRLARIRTSIEYRQTDDVIADLAVQMGRVQAAVAESAAEVTKSYFPSRAVSMWTGEVV
jgi:uncharacterized alpha-E superfamily protein